MNRWRIEPLGREHDLKQFDCGQPALNDWLKSRAGQFERRDLSRTYVATREADPRVCGDYSISAHAVVHANLPDDLAKGLPRLDVPVVLLGKLAVDQVEQGQGLGALLLVDALRRTVRIADELGIRAVEVDAVDDAAKRFYQRFGFQGLVEDPRHLFLPMQVIRRLHLDANE